MIHISRADSIEGVEVRPIHRIDDDRGSILKMLRSDDPQFDGFGEIYFSLIFPGAIKAWRRHRHVTSRLAVPIGAIQLVLYDDRADSSSNGKVFDLTLEPQNYCVVTVPPRIWSGFKGLSPATALVANCATHPHDAFEVDRLLANDRAMPDVWKT